MDKLLDLIMKPVEYLGDSIEFVRDTLTSAWFWFRDLSWYIEIVVFFLVAFMFVIAGPNIRELIADITDGIGGLIDRFTWRWRVSVYRVAMYIAGVEDSAAEKVGPFSAPPDAPPVTKSIRTRSAATDTAGGES